VDGLPVVIAAPRVGVSAITGGAPVSDGDRGCGAGCSAGCGKGRGTTDGIAIPGRSLATSAEPGRVDALAVARAGGGEAAPVDPVRPAAKEPAA
jgi:hypothetical protein